MVLDDAEIVQGAGLAGRVVGLLEQIQGLLEVLGGRPGGGPAAGTRC
jgi:hypothetical protein